MTQNTADRLYLLLVDRLRVIGGPRHAAEDIAAEIDALRDEMAVILRERNDAHLALAEARAEVDGLAAQLSSADRSREATEDRLNRLESALAIAGIYPFAGDYAAAVYALHGDVIAVRAALDRAVGERDEARAEVERLRPAAEAWEALEAWRLAEKKHDATESEVFSLIFAHEAAAARARAAKESQP